MKRPCRCLCWVAFLLFLTIVSPLSAKPRPGCWLWKQNPWKPRFFLLLGTFDSDKKGFKELAFAGEHVTEPFVGIATSVEKIQSNPTQVKKMLRAFLHRMKAITERKEAAGFIARSYRLEPEIAAEMYETTFRTLTKDGTLDQGVLRDFVKVVKEEVGVTKNVAVAEVADFSLLSEALKETGN